jgi:DNA repair ATPase RecN
MPGGRFAARLVPRRAGHAQGAEDVVFEVQLNAGLDARPLALGHHRGSNAAASRQLGGSG